MRAVFYNGIFTDYDSLGIPLTDRAIFFGDGVYDVVTGHGGGMHLWREHCERFYSNIARISLSPYMPREELYETARKVIGLSGEDEYIVYMQASGRSAERTHARTEASSNLLIAVFPYSAPREPGYIDCRTVRDTRGLNCDVKSINLLPAVLASTVGEAGGYAESIYLRDGTVTEAAHSSVAVVKDGILITHPNGEKILPGITRKRVLEICKEHGVGYLEVPYTERLLYEADEVLILSTTKLCKRVRRLCGVEIGRGAGKIGDMIFYELLKDNKNE